MIHHARLRHLGTAVLAAALVACLAAPAPAEVRFGYIDSGRIFSEYKAAQEAQARFDRQVQGWRDEATERERQVNLLRAEVRDQAPILSSLRRQEKEEALQKAIAEYEKFIQDIWGPQGRAAAENERATADVVQQIRSAVEKIAADRNLNLVLDAASGGIIYADKTLDLTPDVLAELNARDKSAGGS
jgi:outer membrane protein